MKYATIFIEEKKMARAICADTYFLRLRGLLGRKLDKGEGLLLSPCRQIHTFFMGYPIDAVYLDSDYHILRIDANIPPGRSLKSEKMARHILELPAQTTLLYNLQIGTVLIVEKE